MSPVDPVRQLPTVVALLDGGFLVRKVPGNADLCGAKRLVAGAPLESGRFWI